MRIKKSNPMKFLGSIVGTLFFAFASLSSSLSRTKSDRTFEEYRTEYGEDIDKCGPDTTKELQQIKDIITEISGPDPLDPNNWPDSNNVLAVHKFEAHRGDVIKTSVLKDEKGKIDTEIQTLSRISHITGEDVRAITYAYETTKTSNRTLKHKSDTVLPRKLEDYQRGLVPNHPSYVAEAIQEGQPCGFVHP